WMTPPVRRVGGAPAQPTGPISLAGGGVAPVGCAYAPPTLLFLFKAGAQHLQAAVQQPPQRPVRQTELRADGFVVGPADVAERERQAILLGQRPQDGEHLGARLAALGLVL